MVILNRFFLNVEKKAHLIHVFNQLMLIGNRSFNITTVYCVFIQIVTGVKFWMLSSAAHEKKILILQNYVHFFPWYPFA